MRYYCVFFSLCLTFLVKEISRVVTYLALFNFQDAVSISRLIYYITFWSFCQVFFESFQKLFCDRRFFEKRLNHYTTTFWICQVFFNFKFSVANHLFSRRLIHYITFRKICQVFFKTFFSQTSVNLFSVVQNSSSVLSSDSFIIISSFFVKVK